MKLCLYRVLLAVAAMLVLGSGSAPATPAQDVPDCAHGAYRSPTGEVLVLSRIGPDRVRVVFDDGRRKMLDEPGGWVRCSNGEVHVGDADEKQEAWQHVPLRVTRTRFESGDVELVGELIEPVGADGKTPLVVLAHGSENFGWVGGRVGHPYLFAAHGVSAFIFDKRGTGLSGGDFHMNFRRLADDLVAASREARRVAEGRYGRFGLHGFSQGGWVVPLAATRAEADFVTVHYGLAISPLEEDAEEVALALREAGHGEVEVARARKVTDTTGALLLSGFTDEAAFDRLAALRRDHSDEPWFADIRGEFSGRILEMDEAGLREKGAETFDTLDIEWDYDTMPSLRSLDIPLLWIVAGSDREAPPKITLARLESLRVGDRPLTVAVFPETDHGIVHFEDLPDGSRRYTDYATGYLRLMIEWSHGRLAPPYGDAEITR
jgi:uncharacterized protein